MHGSIRGSDFVTTRLNTFKNCFEFKDMEKIPLIATPCPFNRLGKSDKMAETTLQVT